MRKRLVSWYPYAFVNTDAQPDLQLLYEDERECFYAYIIWICRRRVVFTLN